jgi:hypothetical protein
MSWILATTYGSYYTSFLPYSLFYIYTSLTQTVQQLISYSYIATSVVPQISYPVVYGYYGGYYWYGYTIGGTNYWYGSLAQSLSDIYPYISYVILLGYMPYSTSYIFAYAFTASPYVYPPPSYSFIHTEVPIFQIWLFDQTIISGPIQSYVYLYDLSYIGGLTSNVSILYDLSYIGGLTPNVSIYDLTDISGLYPNMVLYDLSYISTVPYDIPMVHIVDISYIGPYP